MNKISLTVIIVICLFVTSINFASAQIFKPFGGRNLTPAPIMCTCDGSYFITVANSAMLMAPEQFLYNPLTTILYGNFLFMQPGVNMLGIASPLPEPCLVASGGGCTPIGVGYRMITLGTSLL